MSDLLKRLKTNALLSAALYALLGLVLLVWPELSTSVLCFALGLILLLCGLGDVIEFLRHRDGSLYAALHLGVGVILAAVGLWLISQPTLVTVVIPRVVGVLICVHGFGDVGDAVTLRKNGSPPLDGRRASGPCDAGAGCHPGHLSLPGLYHGGAAAGRFPAV